MDLPPASDRVTIMFSYTFSLNSFTKRNLCIYLFIFLAVVEAHPDNSHEDLRLDKPFPGLIEYMSNMDLDSMDKHVSILFYTFI